MATDEALMCSFQQGCDEAFERIVRRWERRMLTFFYRAVADMDTAKDLRQELFVRLYVHGRSYRGDGSFRAWFFRIAANLIRAHFRQRRWFVSTDELDAGSHGETQVSFQDCVRGDEIVHRNERARLVRDLLGTLRAKDRDVLVLRFFGGLRFAEIAQALGMTEVTTRVHAVRALGRLRSAAVQRGLTARDLLE